MSKKFTIAGSLVVTEDLSVKNLTVTGKTITENQETLSVKDNLIITNAEGVDLQSLLSGLTIRKDSLSAYGIVYDPTDDSVKLGLGSIVAGEFEFDQNEGLPVVVRGDLVDGNLVQFSSTGNKLVDSGKKISDIVTFADVATTSKYGVVRLGAGLATGSTDGGIIATIQCAPDVTIAARSSKYHPIVPDNLDYAMMLAITGTKIINGIPTTGNYLRNLDDNEKTTACEWLGAIERPADTSGMGAYIKNNVGKTALLKFSEAPTKGTLAYRDSNGNFQVNTPVNGADCSNKDYADTKVTSLVGNTNIANGDRVYVHIKKADGTDQDTSRALKWNEGTVEPTVSYNGAIPQYSNGYVAVRTPDSSKPYAAVNVKYVDEKCGTPTVYPLTNNGGYYTSQTPITLGKLMTIRLSTVSGFIFMPAVFVPVYDGNNHSSRVSIPIRYYDGAVAEHKTFELIAKIQPAWTSDYSGQTPSITFNTDLSTLSEYEDGNTSPTETFTGEVAVIL